MTRNDPKNFWITLLTCVILAQTCQAFPIPEGAKVEHVTDLGFGFYKVDLLVPTPWEMAHYGDLYYRDQKLSRLGKCSVSPSGDYVIYQEGPTAHIFLYRREDGHPTQLTIRPMPLVTEFVWREDAGTVDVLFGTKSFSIQKVMEQEPVEVQPP